MAVPKEKKDPLVSVVMPTFNRADLIRESITSVLDQSYANWEVLVMDDCSTDRTAEVVGQILREDKRVKFFPSPVTKRRGANYCRNRGVSVASGEYVVFLDSDDLFISDKLNQQIEVLTNDKSLRCCVSFARLFSTDDRAILENVWINKPRSKDMLLEVIQKNVRWPISGPIWCRSFLPENPFDERIQAGQDYEFHVRMASKMKEAEVFVIDRPTVLVRVSNSSISRNKELSRFQEYIKGRCLLIEEGEFRNKYKLKLLKSVESSYLKLSLAGINTLEVRKYEMLYRKFNPVGYAKLRIKLEVQRLKKIAKKITVLSN